MSEQPITVVIFGASGDLTKHKLVPALFHLFAKGRLPTDVQIVGSARSPLSDEQFRFRLADALEKEAHSEHWSEFARRLHYVAGDATTSIGMAALQSWLAEREGTGGNRLYYLSVSPDLYPGIIAGLGEAGMSREERGWRRLVIEKPFGRDLAMPRRSIELSTNISTKRRFTASTTTSARRRCRTSWFFASPTPFRAGLEPQLHRPRADHRGRERSQSAAERLLRSPGVLRDMFQNHLLQVLTLVAMEARPLRRRAAAQREAQGARAMPVPTPEEARRPSRAGQYDGLSSKRGVAPGSRTPTFAAVELHIDNWRWQGVPFYLRSGKGLDGASARSSSSSTVRRT